MKILILEYITGGGLAGAPLPDSLVREGRLMANALAGDLLRVTGVELLVPWDARLPAPAYGSDPRVSLRPVADAQGYETALRSGLNECDAVWPVAPETGGVLEALCVEVAKAGRKLLSSPADVVALTASKRATTEHLDQRGVPVVPAYVWGSQPQDLPLPWVVKPDDGVGCDGVRRVDEPTVCRVQAEGAWLVQPYIPGPALSLSALFWQGQARLLSVNRQRIAIGDSGDFRLTGCEVGALPDDSGVYAALAQKVAQAVPGLAGYAGIDFIDSADGPRVLEINPRLTSSYAGVRPALRVNPAELVLALFDKRSLPWLPGVAGRPVLVEW